MRTLADRLVAARNQRGLTQDQLAKAARLRGQSIVGMLESGARKSSSYIPAIAEVLGVSALWLSEGRGPMRAGDQDSDRDQDHAAPQQKSSLLLSSNTQPESRQANSPPVDRWPLSESDYERFAALSPEGRAWALSQFAAGISAAEHMYPAERQANRA